MTGRSGKTDLPSEGAGAGGKERPNTKRTGELAEAAFLHKAVGLGLKVTKPWGDSERYDFVVDAGERLWRVQIKCTAAVRAGEWWRLVTYPFVHVSWYHLLLDAAAFFTAYVELRHRRGLERLGFVAAAGAGGLLAAWWLAPIVFTRGLCGLSGVAHGLTVGQLERVGQRVGQ